ncbi:glycogen phosphorylase [Thioalkalivibrio denitrificans]|uniref:Alpha-1,4 glucan phosphorylase n=1 Tax=Thioalkalivibrio denitrificans TaxID=108003 RepID=A0A1V3NDK2_9GAMM|nr:glycogen/starch/alpha-glucan phosphorylase [Thioalkalivibrio denitrificans]OOG23064.1 glycogen phosphorylase [Thioalkalivibrio denitrificans]
MAIADILHELEHHPRPCDKEGLKKSIRDALIHQAGKDPLEATPRDWLEAVSYAIRERLIERRMFTQRLFNREHVKRVYYLSMEYLIGRMLINSLLNLGFYEACREALSEMGVDLLGIAELEPDAALGNGGLGRLAACILDSMASQCMPGYGYGIRYEYGMFQQQIENGQQIEHPDNWLRYGNNWEFPRPEKIYRVRFYGRVVTHRDNGNLRHHWQDCEEVIAMAYDHPTPGYGNKNVNNLRLWAAKSTRDFDLNYFNEGDYIGAIQKKAESETISMVLYPNDATAIGRELRLKQEYFFVSASIQDVLDHHEEMGYRITELPDKVALQLNDTHPAIAVAELMRLLLDKYQLPWMSAWEITKAVFGYTNHTLLPEALETWPVEVMERVLPRHMQIIYDINFHFLNEVRHTFPGDTEVIKRLSIIDEEHGRQVRMAHLAVVGSHKINGVAALHTKLLESTLFHDFYRLWPERFVSITNGITPRLWLHQANPALCALISEHIGRDWVMDLSQLRALESFADDPKCREEFRAVKEANKRRLADLVLERTGIRIDPNAMFDVQVKRIHEYKRQLLNILHVIAFYNRIRRGEAGDQTKRVVLFGGKAAPSYVRAKQVIRLINDVADLINHDPMVNDRLKVVFFPNYDVSAATVIIPAADLSEQISTAGMEASGTGNMKLALNGALTIGTLDGANVEIRDAVGEENMFIFGLTAEEVAETRARGYRPRECYQENAELKEVLNMIGSGFFTPDDPARYGDLVDDLLNNDAFLVLADFAAYVQAQEQVDALYTDREDWTRRAMLNTARMGYFSIDRTVQQYAEEVWGVVPECWI